MYFRAITKYKQNEEAAAAGDYDRTIFISPTFIKQVKTNNVFLVCERGCEPRYTKYQEEPQSCSTAQRRTNRGIYQP